MITIEIDSQIETLKRQIKADAGDFVSAARLEALLRRAGRDKEADKVPVPTHMTSASAILDYVTGSDGIKPRAARFTVERMNGARTTYSARREALSKPEGWDAMSRAQKDAYVASNKDDGRSWIVGAMSGSINTSNYPAIGRIMKDEAGALRFFWDSNSAVAETDVTVQGMGWLFAKVRGGISPASIRFYNEGRCSCCGKVLTVAESRRRGRGPVCDRKHGRGSDGVAVQPRLANGAVARSQGE